MSCLDLVTVRVGDILGIRKSCFWLLLSHTDQSFPHNCKVEDAGIDVSMFTAHSVRGASSLPAAMAGRQLMSSLRLWIGALILCFKAFITDLCILQVLQYCLQDVLSL